ncbi:MAG: Rrf2 family transcriptional regulator [Thermovirga sp.]
MKNVIQISEASSLAFHGMGLLALRGGRISVHEMASLTGSSEAHLSKVFQRLSREGFVSSVRGPGGGFILTRPAEEITLLQIYSAIEGEPSSNPCIMARGRCPFNGCIFKELIPEVTERFLHYLSETTLAEMVDKNP